jgi:hypothetical protein
VEGPLFIACKLAQSRHLKFAAVRGKKKKKGTERMQDWCSCER